ncbi:kelch-like protein 7, partial [Drosophila erecta]|uniref:kelch-like protein 7 n=1 Tax=Drosophila erecta TaxID=7220 RepID=UPI000F0612C8
KKQTFECHKVILASASEFFERMFLSDFNESKSGKFVLNDVQPETFAHFLHYVYTYDTKALQKHATLTMIMELLVCGSSWLVESIVFDCVAIIKMKLPTMLIGDLVRVFQKAHDIEKEDLIICCKNQLHSRYRETMNCCETVFLTSEVFKQYLIITQDCLPEVERFKMMQTYLSVNGLIDNEAVEPTEHVYGDVGQVELPENSNDDDGPKEKERDDSESLGKPLTSKAAIDANGRRTDDVLLTEEPKGVKIKLIHQKYVKTLVDHINFSNMFKKEFYSVVGNSDLFNYKEKYEYLYLTK